MAKVIKHNITYNSAPSTATLLPYDNRDSGLSATTVKSAIDELKSDVDTKADSADVPQDLADLDDVTISSVTSDQILKYNGSNWVNANESGGSTVSVTQIQSTGTKIAIISVDSVDTDLYAPNGGGNGGHTIVDDAGTDLTQRTNLQFKGAYSEDNSTDDTTEVNVVREMTKAEFDVLSDAEKVGFINITDITSSSDDRFQPVVYSLDEREIGVYADGKPLYQKTLKAENVTISDSTGYPFDITSLNVDSFIEMPSGYIRLTNDVRSLPFGLVGTYSCGVDANPTTVTVTRRNGTGNLPVVEVSVTIRYTKTTDTAGSGQWTPQGVPAAHYNETEHICGTWVDGSTLYEKTFVKTNLTGNTSNWVNIDTLTGVDKIVSCDGFAIGNDGNYVDLGYYVRISWKSDNIRYYCKDLSTVTLTYIIFTLRYTKSS